MSFEDHVRAALDELPPNLASALTNVAVIVEDENPEDPDLLGLYHGVVSHITLERRFSPALPPVRLDVEQIRRVVINLIDNAIEAMADTPGTITIETQHDAGNAVARLIIADNGPGVPPAEREKLFMPYYSTKGRGSGLGLAIVRRIVAEHGGSIEVGDNAPHGSRFVIELPC